MAEQIPEIPQAVVNLIPLAAVNPAANHERMLVQPVVNPLADISSPFYLHPSESLGVVLISSPLTETNYYSWSRVMQIALHSKDKLGFIDGEILEPPIGDPL